MSRNANKVNGKTGCLIWIVIFLFIAFFIAAVADEHHNPALNKFMDFFKLSGSEYYISTKSRR
ncbi:hypothetical protein [Marinobacterium sp. xm-d-579]|uniref:hypothetical protein n=1 Tax=Marinobacterium sp. xm-d-579 TaxID=2497734 RepID=UPI001568D106|nr:hypothetical protein [Marinobacterium sp. xm-d-579]